MEALSQPFRQEAMLRTLTSEVLKTGEIDGAELQPQPVASCVARLLGIDHSPPKPTDRHLEGAVELALDATRNCSQPLTADRIFDWHAGLFPAGRSGNARIAVGVWRTDAARPAPMEAPAASRLDREMAAFLNWFNRPPDIDEVLKAGIAHLWFATLEPFEDGNGRVARAIADLALARSENTAHRFYSLSTQIRHEQAAYYAILEQTQTGTMDITAWLEWFLACLGRAIDAARTLLGPVLAKARFWEGLHGVALNQRQTLLLNLLLDGLEGKFTTSKYAALAECSHDTALRDILPLVERGILTRGPEGGRSTSYTLADIAERDIGH
jgi:Fic family protein